MRKIEVHCEEISLPYKEISTKIIKDVSSTIFKILNIENIEVAIIITGNEYIKEINKEYRNKNYPTDVISFAERDNKESLMCHMSVMNSSYL